MQKKHKSVIISHILLIINIKYEIIIIIINAQILNVDSEKMARDILNLYINYYYFQLWAYSILIKLIFNSYCPLVN